MDLTNQTGNGFHAIKQEAALQHRRIKSSRI